MMFCYVKCVIHNVDIVVLLVQFYLSKSDLVRFERELSQSNRREILMQAARNLPMQCRTITGGVFMSDVDLCERVLLRSLLSRGGSIKSFMLSEVVCLLLNPELGQPKKSVM